MLKREILREIDRTVDSEDFLQLARSVAEKAQGLNDTQVRKLQNVVNSTTRFSEIMNFVKAQTGRHPKEWKHLGPETVKSLDKIDHYAAQIAAGQDRGEVRLKLSRLWVKIVVAEFLYNSETPRN